MSIMLLGGAIILATIVLTIINQKSLQLPTTVAVLIATATLSASAIIYNKVHPHTLDQYFNIYLQNIDFSEILTKFMLGFMLFAGAITINIQSLKSSIKEIFTLAFFSTIISTIIVATLTFYLLYYTNHLLNLNIQLSFLGCLLFAALISPTDPIAVLGVLKTMNANKALSTKLAGESLFNDGVGIVIFLTFYQISFNNSYEFTATNVLSLFLKQALGGLFYGFILGIIMQYMIKICSDIKIHILISIAMTTFGYALAEHIAISGPLAMVVLGIMTNFEHKSYQLPVKSKQSLDQFWEIIDELLNLVLFFLIGAELIILDISAKHTILMLAVIPIALFARFFSILLPIKIFKLIKKQLAYTVKILTWGGLRGGLAIALALSLPNTPEKNIILTLTYPIVLFSIIIQGTSIKYLIKN